MTLTNFIIILTIVLYLVGMLIIGAICSKHNKNTDDFYLGGRKLGPLVTAMSAEASDMSSWLLMGIPAIALMNGLSLPLWTSIGLILGTYLNWLFIAKRLRIYTSKLNAVTLPEFFSLRFKDDNKILTVVSALFIIVFLIPYTASGFAACGKLFSSLFGVNYLLAMIISAIIIIFYCTAGGFLAASTTDLIQSIVMTFALLIVVIFSIISVGGIKVIFNDTQNLNGYLDVFKGFNVAKNTQTQLNKMEIISILAWGLGYFGMPPILLRFMAINDANKLKCSRRVATIWVIISMFCAVFIGIAGYSLIKNGIIPNYSSATNAETIIVDISKYISAKGIAPAFAAGTILAGILASTMSTADSQLLAASSSISQNILQEKFKIKLSSKKSILVARLSVLVVSIIAIIIAIDPNSSVFKIVSFSWAGFGAAFGPLVLLSLFWKRTTLKGALFGIITGGIMTFIWKFVIRQAFVGSILDIYELLPAFIISLLVIIVVSLTTKKPDNEVIRIFEEVKTDIK